MFASRNQSKPRQPNRRPCATFCSTATKSSSAAQQYPCTNLLPHVWAFDAAANSQALDCLGKAIEIEPKYPLALSMASWCHARRAIYHWTSQPSEARAEGLRLAKLAGEINNEDPMVLTLLCAAHSVVGDLDMACALSKSAASLDPNSAMAWTRSGWVNVYLARPEIAISDFHRALRLSPFDPMNFNCSHGIGFALSLATFVDSGYARVNRGRPFS
jgi:adenylate cyclase